MLSRLKLAARRPVQPAPAHMRGAHRLLFQCARLCVSQAAYKVHRSDGEDAARRLVSSEALTIEARVISTAVEEKWPARIYKHRRAISFRRDDRWHW